MSINIASRIVHFAGHIAGSPAPAAVPIAQRVQRPGVGLPWYLFALVLARSAVLPVLCSPSGCAGGWGLHRRGIWDEPGVGWVDSLRRKNSKKAFLLKWWRFTTPSFLRKSPPPLLPISKISRKNKKTPTKGLCSVLYLPYKP